MTKKLGEIFEIPEAVHQGDFVLRLTEGLQADRRKNTLRDYVVTDQLVGCFDQALSLVGSALDANSSKGAYLHGSFGSGKSHFMAVLDLLLEGDSDARALPELAGVVAKHNRWWEGRKFLVVPFHMIGATSMESAILGGYAKFVRNRHPDAPTPGFYQSHSLIENARKLRAQMGDALFFDKLGGDAGGDGGWGALGGGWDAEGFEAASAAAPEDPEHQRLVGDLVDAYFSHLKTSGSDGVYLDLDQGLAILSQHAAALGYASVVLFLDELILWLASHSADQVFLNQEGQKVAKLVEAGEANRPIPIVSFIARQRDLRELVGEAITGADQLSFADVLQWWEARFDKVVLEDRNLPAIIERRLLRTKGDDARRALQEGFEQTAKVRQEVMDILLTHDGDKQMFEKVYPFSPALVQTLVALSSLLQRERTALKLMLQLLVRNRDRLSIGDVIPVGDLFDVIMEGDEPFTPTIKRLFDQARGIWLQKFLPMLEEEHGVTEEAVRNGEADENKARAFRSHAGLLKTLVLSALAPEVESLRNLTTHRLAALNHGTVRSPLANQEASIVLNKMREWASHAGEIHISPDPGNPVISMQLVGVDIEGILENARSIDNFGNRVRTVKNLLFRDFEIDPEAAGLLTPSYDWLWRGTRRSAEMLFQNVRELNADNFHLDDESGWRVIIDFPFDEGNHTPADDRAKVQEFLDGDQTANTIVWLPNFLNERALSDLKRLVILNHVLLGNRLEEYGAHLQPAERSEARSILKNQRDALERRVTLTLQQAYGIAQGGESTLHTTHSLDNNFLTLTTGLRLQPPPGGGFKESLENLLDQSLSFQYPAHPLFEGEVKKLSLKKTWSVVDQAVSEPDGRIGMEANVREDVKRIAVPLKLGECGEAHLVLGEHWRTHFDRKLAEKKVTNPTVRQLREWCDEPKKMGLPDDIGDLVIMTFAAQTGRSFYLHGAVIKPEVGALQREMELREQELPPEDDWNTAVERASELFGVAVAATRNATNVADLIDKVQAAAKDKQDSTASYLAELTPRFQEYKVDQQANRAQTADACKQLSEKLTQCEANDVVSALAKAQIATSATAMGVVMTKATRLIVTLRSSEWTTISSICRSRRSDPRARAIIESMTAALEHDENVTALDQQLMEQHRKALELIEEPPPPPPPPPPPVEPGEVHIQRTRSSLSDARTAMKEAEDKLSGDSTLRADIDIRVYKPGSDE